MAESAGNASEAGSLQDAGNVGGSADDFAAWVRRELGRSPLRGQGFGDLLDSACTVLCRIRQSLGSLPDNEGKAVWQRLMKRGRMLKEANEALPVVARVLQWIDVIRRTDLRPITVIDLCSGVGYLSLFLSELLAQSGRSGIVARFVLVDSAWPMGNQEGPLGANHINPAHLAKGVWSHIIGFRKQDLKASSGQRQLAQYVLARAPGPVAVLGVHLCGLLAIRAVQFYNDHPRCCFFALKPCCLPDAKLAKQKYAWQLGGHVIDAREVCGSGKYSRGKWKGTAPKGQDRSSFHRWCVSFVFAGTGSNLIVNIGTEQREQPEGGYLRGRCDHLCAGVDVRHGGTKELVHHKLVDECDAVADGSCERVEPGSEAGEQGRTCPAFEGAASADGACGSKGLQDEICSEQSCSSGSHGRYQTAFLFAERPYSPAEGEVGKIGGGPDDQFWRGRRHDSQPVPSAGRDQSHQTEPTNAGAHVRISPDSELRP